MFAKSFEHQRGAARRSQVLEGTDLSKELKEYRLVKPAVRAV